jgi:ribonuclease D
LATLYPILRERLEAEGRMAWVAEEMKAMTSPALYDTSPENAWKRLRPRRQTPKYITIFKAIAAWRERTAQMRDQPRGRILKDDAIDELATQAPTDLDGLERLRSLQKGFGGSKFGAELIEVIRDAARSPEALAAPVARESAPPPPANAGAVVELLKVLLKARAEDAGVASKLIATMADLEKIAADDEADTPALEGWRREAFGEDALKVKRGELALVLDGARVRTVEVRRRPRET